MPPWPPWPTAPPDRFYAGRNGWGWRRAQIDPTGECPGLLVVRDAILPEPDPLVGRAYWLWFE